MMNTDDWRHLAPPPAAEAREQNGGGPGWRALAGTVAAAGLGMPTKYRLSGLAVDWMLKRARRMAAADT